jgi:hypothetical protein
MPNAEEVKEKRAELKNIDVSKLRAKPLTEERRLLISNEIGNVPIRKPNKQRFFVIKEGDDWQGEFNVIILKEEKEYYVLTQDYMPPIELMGDTARVQLNLGQYSDDGSVFLMPTMIPKPEDEDKKWTSWVRSQIRCIEMAKKTPIRMQANMSEGGYRPTISEITPDIPPLPEGKTFDDFIKRAFEDGDRIVNSSDHQVVRKLLGKKKVTA